MQIVRKDNEQKLAMMQGDRSIANTSTLVSPATSGNEHVGNVNGLVGLFFSNFLKHLVLKGAASRLSGRRVNMLRMLQVQGILAKTTTLEKATARASRRLPDLFPNDKRTASPSNPRGGGAEH